MLRGQDVFTILELSELSEPRRDDLEGTEHSRVTVDQKFRQPLKVILQCAPRRYSQTKRQLAHAVDQQSEK